MVVTGVFLLMVVCGTVWGEYGHGRDREDHTPMPCKQFVNGESTFNCKNGNCVLDDDPYYNPVECNSVIDCDNGEDENPANCRKPHSDYCKTLGYGDDESKFNNKWRRCDSGMCIRLAYWGDGLWDCYDQTDESGSAKFKRWF